METAKSLYLTYMVKSTWRYVPYILLFRGLCLYFTAWKGVLCVGWSYNDDVLAAIRSRQRIVRAPRAWTNKQVSQQSAIILLLVQKIQHPLGTLNFKPTTWQYVTFSLFVCWQWHTVYRWMHYFDKGRLCMGRKFFRYFFMLNGREYFSLQDGIKGFLPKWFWNLLREPEV